MTLVDYNALGVGVLDYVLQPTPIIPSNPAERTDLDSFILDQALYEANRLLANPSDLSNINRHHQYDTPETFYRMFYSTGNTTFRTAANHLVEVYRDGQFGFSSQAYDPLIAKAYCENTPNNWNNVAFNGYSMPTCQGWASYPIVNPGGEAAAGRKVRDILKYEAGALFQFYNIEIQPNSGGEPVRERGGTLNWCFMNLLINGASSTIQNLDKDSFVVRTYTAQEMVDETLDAMLVLVYHPAIQRPGFWGDFGAGANGIGTNYTGNMNLAGTAAEALTRVDRWKNRTGQPDARIYTELRKWLDWLEYGIAPGITAGSQWVSTSGNFGPNQWGPGWRYYHYQSGSYGANGTHPGTEWNLNGHNLSPHAQGYARDANATDRQRFRQRIFDACNSMRNVIGGGRFFDARQWSEANKTWQPAFGIMEEADGGPVGPPPSPPPPGPPPPPPVGLSLREHLTGWETGGHGECAGTVGTVQTSQKRSGLYALKLTSTGSPVRYSFPRVPLTQTQEFAKVHCRFHVTAAPSSATTFDLLALDNGAKARGGAIRVTVATSGAISAQGYNYQTGATFGGSVTIPADTWVLIDLHVVIDATVGVIEWHVDQASGAAASNVNTGTGTITDWATFEPPTTNSLNLDVYYDDAVLDANIMPAASRVIARQGKAGTPTYNGFVKTGGGTAATVWSETPFSATNEAHSNGAQAQQTMLVADVAAGTDPADANDLLLHAWVVMVAKEIA